MREGRGVNERGEGAGEGKEEEEDVFRDSVEDFDGEAEVVEW